MTEEKDEIRPYLDMIDLDRPVHKNDAFAAKHPQMDVHNRAKQFAPFDALRGYAEAIEKTTTDYNKQD